MSQNNNDNNAVGESNSKEEIEQRIAAIEAQLQSHGRAFGTTPARGGQSRTGLYPTSPPFTSSNSSQHQQLMYNNNPFAATSHSSATANSLASNLFLRQNASQQPLGNIPSAVAAATGHPLYGTDPLVSRLYLQLRALQMGSGSSAAAPPLPPQLQHIPDSKVEADIEAQRTMANGKRFREITKQQHETLQHSKKKKRKNPPASRKDYITSRRGVSLLSIYQATKKSLQQKDSRKKSFTSLPVQVLISSPSEKSASFPLPVNPRNAESESTAATLPPNAFTTPIEELPAFRQEWERLEMVTDAMDDTPQDQQRFVQELLSRHCTDRRRLGNLGRGGQKQEQLSTSIKKESEETKKSWKE